MALDELHPASDEPPTSVTNTCFPRVLLKAPLNLEQLRQVDFPGRESLTPREFEVLLHVVGGMTNKVIGHELGISTKTVETYRVNIMYKMRAKDAVSLTWIFLTGVRAPFDRSDRQHEAE